MQEVEIELSLVTVERELPGNACHLRTDVTTALEERTG